MFLNRIGVSMMNFLKRYSFPILIVVCSCLTFAGKIKEEATVSGAGYQMGAGDFYLNFFGGSEMFEASPGSLLKIPYFLFLYGAYFLLLQSIQREKEYSEAGIQQILRRKRRTQIWTHQVLRLWKSGAVYFLCTALVCMVAGMFVYGGGWQIHSLLQEKIVGLDVGIFRQGGRMADVGSASGAFDTGYLAGDLCFTAFAKTELPAFCVLFFKRPVLV